MFSEDKSLDSRLRCWKQNFDLQKEFVRNFSLNAVESLMKLNGVTDQERNHKFKVIQTEINGISQVQNGLLKKFNRIFKKNHHLEGNLVVERWIWQELDGYSRCMQEKVTQGHAKIISAIFKLDYGASIKMNLTNPLAKSIFKGLPIRKSNSLTSEKGANFPKFSLQEKQKPKRVPAWSFAKTRLNERIIPSTSDYTHFESYPKNRYPIKSKSVEPVGKNLPKLRKKFSKNPDPVYQSHVYSYKENNRYGLPQKQNLTIKRGYFDRLNLDKSYWESTQSDYDDTSSLLKSIAGKIRKRIIPPRNSRNIDFGTNISTIKPSVSKT